MKRRVSVSLTRQAQERVSKVGGGDAILTALNHLAKLIDTLGAKMAFYPSRSRLKDHVIRTPWD